MCLLKEYNSCSSGFLDLPLAKFMSGLSLGASICLGHSVLQTRLVVLLLLFFFFFFFFSFFFFFFFFFLFLYHINAVLMLHFFFVVSHIVTFVLSMFVFNHSLF